MDKDKVLEFLKSDEQAKKWFQGKLDSHFSRGLETWKKTGLPKLIEEHDKSKIDPHERKVSELQQALEMKKKVKALKLKTAETGLDRFVPSEAIVEVLATLDDEQANHTINLLTEHVTGIFNRMLSVEIDSRIGDTTPRNDGQTNQNVGSYTKNQLLTMDYETRARFYVENPTEYNRIMNS